MAVYGRDYYGRAKYGSSLRFEMVVDPFEAEISGYDTVSLTWAEPGGAWSGFRLVRSRSGFPIAEDDGELVLEFPPGYAGATGGSFLDSNLRGGWYYYAIFLWDSGALVWERSSAVDVLVPFDFKSTDLMWDTLPDYYRQVRDSGAGLNQQTYRINPAIYLNNEEVSPNLQLASFLKTLGWGFDLLRSQADQVLDGYDISAVHVNRMALLAAQFGAEVEESAPAHVNRTMIRNLGWLYRKRGTVEGIRELVSLVTGWEVDVVLGPNLMLNEDQTNMIHPQPQMWDATVKYATGDRIRYGNYLYQAIQPAYGTAQGPNVTRTSNAYWDADSFIEPLRDTTVARTDTGDISTWQIEGPSGFISGGTGVARGTVDPEDGTVFHRNSLAFVNNTGAIADFTLRSIPRRADNLASWDKRLVITDGTPVPRATKVWDAAVRYRAGDIVLYKNSPYRALTTLQGTTPDATASWQRLGYDDRQRLCLSWWSHGPYNGTVNTGGLTQRGVITQFDENGDFVAELLADSAVYTNVYYDPFGSSGSFAVGRTPAKGAAWATQVGSWSLNRDDEGGYAYPVTLGSRILTLAPATLADGNVGVTYRALSSGARGIGLVFRWVGASNFWVATQTSVFKIVAGVKTDPASGALSYASFVAGDRMRVSLSGNTIQVFKNGVSMGTATDAFNATANRHGVLAEAS